MDPRHRLHKYREPETTDDISEFTCREGGFRFPETIDGQQTVDGGDGMGREGSSVLPP